MKFRTRFKSVFLILTLVSSVGSASYEKATARTDILDFSTGTFIFGKLLLIPFLATIGLKFLALLPVMLSKIAMLGIMNFIASNMNLLLSVALGLKNFMQNRWGWYDEETPQYDISPIETAPSSTKFDILLDSQFDKGPKVFRFNPSGGDFFNVNKRDKTFHYTVDPKILKKVQPAPIVSPVVHDKKYYCQQTATNAREGRKYKCVWVDVSQNPTKRKYFVQPVESSRHNDPEVRSPVYLGAVSDLQFRDEEKNVNNSILNLSSGKVDR